MNGQTTKRWRSINSTRDDTKTAQRCFYGGQVLKKVSFSISAMTCSTEAPLRAFSAQPHSGLAHGSTKPQQDNENCWRNNLCLTATFAGHLPRTACTKPAASWRTPNILRMAGLHSGKIQKYKRLFRTVILSVCTKQTQAFIFVNI